ncbi:uncharacterized protein [Halyomorpha halys]|uniref:uncharacterized protein isoform X2 n=1 Tax=Halyomorpha halys TaxID=286706 RepID=UPI0006D517A3|nr:uncharacterized protein LOC106690988 isoform X2 [Halyomorpha halys]
MFSKKSFSVRKLTINNLTPEKMVTCLNVTMCLEIPSSNGKFSEMLEEPLISGLELDKEFLQGVLRESEADPYLEIVSVESSPGCNIGDNYMSAVSRLVINAETPSHQSFQKSLLMKRQPASIARRQAFRCDPAFRNEAAAYRKVLPGLCHFAGCRLAFPQCLHASSQFVVLEDLKQAGYEMADRAKGLDLAHAKLALEELGRFHGTSLALKHVDPKSFSSLKTAVQELVFVPEAVPVFGASLENSLRMALMGLEVYKAAGETIIQEAVHKMQILRGTVFQRMLYLVKPKEPLSVICHGDFYINNMLFRYENSEEPESVMFVDLQVCRYASLATDILYFLYSSLQPGVVSLYHDELIEVYQAALNAEITRLAPGACEVSMKQIQDEIENHALYGLIMAFLILPAVTALPGATLNLDKVESFSSDEFLESAREILSPRYFERLRELVLDFVDRGYI